MIATRPLVTVAALLHQAEADLRRQGIPTPRLDAEVLLAATLGVSRAGLYARLRDAVDESVDAAYRVAIERRGRREPVAYITGTKEFCSLSFAVTPAVLVPRPETEDLVERVRQLLQHHPSPLICDVGTGSGCIAVAVARFLPRATLVAVDVSAAALQVAHVNASLHGVPERVLLMASDLLTGVAAGTRFDLIVSNPPYLKPGDAVSPEVDWEPSAALVSGGDGLIAIRRLLASAPAYLHDDGTLVMEFGDGQSSAVLELAAAAGFQSLAIERDLGGNPRVLIARAKSEKTKRTNRQVAKRSRDSGNDSESVIPAPAGIHPEDTETL